MLAQRTGRRGRLLIRWRALINGQTWILRAKGRLLPHSAYRRVGSIPRIDRVAKCAQLT